VREVARAHVAAAERGRVGERYLLGGANASLLEFVTLIGELDGKPVPKHASPAWLLKLVAAIGESVSLVTGNEPTLTREAATMASRSLFCDCTRAKDELGFQAVPLRRMVEDCYRWMKDEGQLDRI
jgi:nucleoside-diphosphate-sugar epimerase